MNLPHFFLLAAAALLPLTALPAPALRVIDGDTIVIAGETIRILNIDAPELHRSKCDAERRLAIVARSRLVEIIGDGRSVKLARGDHGRMKDRHGRSLARISVNGHDVGETLIRESLARPWDGKRGGWCN